MIKHIAFPDIYGDIFGLFPRQSNQIKEKKAAHYLQLNFATIPKHVNKFSNTLKLDSNVTRFSIFNY